MFDPIFGVAKVARLLDVQSINFETRETWAFLFNNHTSLKKISLLSPSSVYNERLIIPDYAMI